MENDNRFVRFHAMQSTIVFGGLSSPGSSAHVDPAARHAALVFIVIPPSAVLCAPPDVQGLPGRALQAADRGDMAEQRDLAAFRDSSRSSGLQRKPCARA